MDHNFLMTSYLVHPEGVAKWIKGGRKEKNTYLVMTSMFCASYGFVPCFISIYACSYLIHALSLISNQFTVSVPQEFN